MITTIAGTDRSANVLEEGFSIKDSLTQIKTMSLKVKSLAPSSSQEIVVTHDGTTLFGGYIKSITASFASPSYIIRALQCQDYSKLIADVNEGVTADYFSGSSNEKAILTALFAAYCPSISVGSYVITGSNVAIRFSNSSLRRAVDELAAVYNRKWYVDENKQLHYFASTGEASPFELSDSPNNSTTYAYSNLEYKLDDDGKETITCKCRQPGLRSGMLLAITNSHLGWTAKTLLITEISVKRLSDSVVEYSLTLGTPPQKTTTEIIRSGQVITTARIADLAVTNAKIADLSVTSAKISDLSVTSAKIADLSITNAKIANLAVTDAKIASLAVSKLTAGSLTVQALLGTGGSIASAASGTRISITPSEIAGYNGSTKQFYIQASDGKAYCGAGAVELSSSGIKVTGQWLLFYSGGVNYGSLYAGAGYFIIDNPNGNIYIRPSGSGQISFGSGTDQQTDLLANFLRPYNSNTISLGGASNYWSYAYTEYLYAQYYRCRSTGGNVWFDNAEYMDVPRRSSAPTGYGGRLYYNTSNYIVYVYSNGGWVAIM